MRSTTGTRLLALVLATGLTAAACSGDEEDTTPSTAAVTTTTLPARTDDGRLVIGVFLPRTGPGATLGEPMVAAIDDAIIQINAAGGVLGQGVRTVEIDENTGDGMAQLVQQGVDAIVGPASSTVALGQLDDAIQPGTGVVTCSPAATAMSLDQYPDNKLFYRTIPSDSLQMAAIAKRVATTGVDSVAVAYLDDRYGRALHEAFTAEANERAFTIRASVEFTPDQEDLSATATEILASQAATVVLLGGPDDATRVLAALDTATSGRDANDIPAIIVNEAVRSGRQAIPALSPTFRGRVTGVAPLAKPVFGDAAGFFTANAVDCVNLIALAAAQAGSDSPAKIQQTMAAVSREGRPCSSYAECVALMEQELQIDYNGLSGPVDLSTTTGDLSRGWFEVFAFDAEGGDVEFDAPFPAP